MCINSKIQQLIDQKAAIDAKIANLEKLEASTVPIKITLADLLKAYSEEASEELPTVWQEILKIGSQYNLAVEPLAADELREWEAVNAENEKLRLELEKARTEIKGYEEAYKGLGEARTHLQGLLEEAQLVQKESPESAEPKEAPAKSIPALTLWQPWASLIRYEVKRIETRSWTTSYRGPIAIHAAKKPVAASDYLELFELLPENCDFPLGCVVAIANLVDCVEMTPEFITAQSEQERLCGDWQPGRFAWILEIIRPVVPPIPATGGQKLWNWTGIDAELKYLNQLNNLSVSNEYDQCFEGESVLVSHGFFMPDINLGDCYEQTEKYEDYRSWGIYRQCHDKGITGLGLYNEDFGFWDANTEMIGDDDPTFPEDFTDGAAIFAWVRKVIDEVVAVTPPENLKVLGQQVLPLEFSESDVFTGDKYDAAVEEELALDDDRWNADKVAPTVVEAETNTNALNFETMGYEVEVYPQYAAEALTGVTYRFLSFEEKGADGKAKLIFSTSVLAAADLNNRSYKTIAQELIQKYREKETARLEKLANPFAKEEDKFVEIVKISNSVGYLKRRDTGELLAGYAAFSNKDEFGQPTATKAKSRAQKWTDYLRANYKASEAGKNLDSDAINSMISDPRKSKRLISDNSRLEFVYEIKFTGLPLDYLERVAKQDLSLLPGKVAPATPAPVTKVAETTFHNFKVKVNFYEIATGNEQEMRSRFEEELKSLGGSQMCVSLLAGSAIMESYQIKDFDFVQVEDFDSDNPEFEVLHKPLQFRSKVWKKVPTSAYEVPNYVASWQNSVYPYGKFTTREAAAADAVYRLLKAQSAGGEYDIG